MKKILKIAFQFYVSLLVHFQSAAQLTKLAERIKKKCFKMKNKAFQLTISKVLVVSTSRPGLMPCNMLLIWALQK